jgi:prepilin-type N-terminal cleavage/methylation domain-containing protein
VKRTFLYYAGRQDGFTLVELIITSVLTLLVMTGLTSVVLTAMRGNDIATGRIEASSQIRNFELRAYDDFAGSGTVAPDPSTCPPLPSGCSIRLQGTQASNSNSPTVSPYNVTYSWSGTFGAPLDRAFTLVTYNKVVTSLRHVATSVTGFSWYLSGRAVVVTLTVTVRSYSETQTFLFYPRISK